MSNVIIPGRFVVSAACRIKELDILVCGPRHFDSVMHKQIGQLHDIHKIDDKKFRWEQGFVDQDGVFMDRKEALVVATEAGQINTRRRKTSPTDRLFSEDLY